MTAQQTDVPQELPDRGSEPVAASPVVRRATQLCLRAEPHADRAPCPAHLSEANRQLVGPAV